jgi:hypothetical protein
MSGLKLDDSIFNTSTNKYDSWDFNITKDTNVNNSSYSNIGDINNNNTSTTNTNNSNWWDGIGDFIGINNTGAKIADKTNTTSSTENDGMFSSGNIGSTLKGAGSVVGALSSIYGTLEQTKFNKETLKMEKDRINRNTEREDKLQKNYEGVWS